VLSGPEEVHVEHVPDPHLHEPTDALVRVLLTCICGSDLWPYRKTPPGTPPRRIGHEFVGVIEEIGSAVVGLKPGDVVVAPFVWSDNTCDYCRAGLHTSCRNGGFWGTGGVDGGQGEAVRVPQAQGTLVKLPVEADSPLLPDLLTLSDVLCTGHHAAVTAGVSPGSTVTVIGDGAVGLCAVLAARRLGAERIVLMGNQPPRILLGREFGATDVVPERGEEGITKVRELTRGDGTHSVLECVGTAQAMATAVGVVRDGGSIARIGLPQEATLPSAFDTWRRNITFTGGGAPARAYIEELLPDILDGHLQPGLVFDLTLGLDETAKGYAAMVERTALKVLLRP
jgi:hypothetical protein